VLQPHMVVNIKIDINIFFIIVLFYPIMCTLQKRSDLYVGLPHATKNLFSVITNGLGQ
jgi:hypothetical protein